MLSRAHSSQGAKMTFPNFVGAIFGAVVARGCSGMIGVTRVSPLAVPLRGSSKAFGRGGARETGGGSRLYVSCNGVENTVQLPPGLIR